jgi:hypothetical protein
MHAVGSSPLPKVHYNSQNTQKKFGGKKFNKNFKENGTTKISIIIRKTRILTKAKALPRKIFTMATPSLQRCGYRNQITKKCHTAKHLVELYQHLLANKLKGTSMKHTSLFNLLTPIAPKILLWKIMIRRSLRRWTTYSALMICS